MAIPTTVPGVRTNYVLTINSVDLSNWVRNVTLSSERNEEEQAAVGQGDDAEWDLGRAAKTFTVTFLIDFYAATIEPTLQALHDAAAGQAFELGPEGNATGDRKYTGTCLLPSMPFDNFSYNQISTVEATFRVTGAMTRTTYA